MPPCVLSAEEQNVTEDLVRGKPSSWRALVFGRSIGLGAACGAALGTLLGLLLMFPAGTPLAVPLAAVIMLAVVMLAVVMRAVARGVRMRVAHTPECQLKRVAAHR